jgi:hypothetical protein
LVSVCVFTHVEPQKVRLESEHAPVQTPLTQVAPCGQPPQASLADFVVEHAGMGRIAAAAIATGASRIDSRTRTVVYFGMSGGGLQQMGCLLSRGRTR